MLQLKERVNIWRSVVLAMRTRVVRVVAISRFGSGRALRTTQTPRITLIGRPLRLWGTFVLSILALSSAFSVSSCERHIINGVPIDNVAAEPANAGVAVSAAVANATHSAGRADKQTPMPRININTASIDELDQGLLGIGRRKAEEIVAYRTRHGAFSNVRQLLEVEGIGEGILQKNRDRIRF